MIATLCVPRGMTWQDTILAHADVIGLARRAAWRRPDGQPRLLRFLRLARATQRLRMENLDMRCGPFPSEDGTSSSD